MIRITFVAIALLMISQLKAQIPAVDILISKAYCEAPDTLTAEIAGLDLSGSYNYVTSMTSCDSPELIGTVEITKDPINENRYYCTDFSFGLFRDCYDIEPPSGTLSWVFNNSLLTWQGVDSYGDSYEFEEFESTTKSWIFQYTNTYDDVATVTLTKNDGTELPYATIDPIEVVNTNFNFAWSTGETTQEILITESGTYEVTVSDDLGNAVTSAVSTTKLNDPHPDFDALMDFYTKTNGEAWNNNSGWKESIEGQITCNPCKEWFGVTCENDRVVSLELETNNLTGELPLSVTDLSELELLNVFNNSLEGSIPPEISKLQNLRAIYLVTNQFTGTIPDELFQLPSISAINLNNNLLTGELPQTITSDLIFDISVSNNNLSGELPSYIGTINLNRLSLSYNNFEGEVPDNPLGESTFGFALSLEGNNFTGSLPAIDSASFITVLNFAYNNFSGEIPASYFQIENQQLSLKYNNLSGELPQEFLDKESMEILELSHNNFTGSIPAYINELTSAILVDLSHNNFSDCIPALDEMCDIAYSDVDTLLSFNNGNTYEFARVAGYDFTNNPLLPWEGDFTFLCNGDNPIGAPCNDGDSLTTNEVITDDCLCEVITSTHELNGQTISILPNPTSDYLNLSISDNKNLKAKLYNTTGQYIMPLYFNTNNALGHLPNGIYFVEIIDIINHKKVIEKLIIN